MAVLTDNVAVVYDPASAPIRRQYKTGAITDEFYRGSIATLAVGTGLAVVTSADASEFLGICDERKTFTGTAGNVWIFAQGWFWFACTAFTDANLIKAFTATAGSDNPADLVTTGVITLTTGATGQVGRLMHVDATGTSGWLDISAGGRSSIGTNA
jgi:hypothetical protein